MSQGLPWWSSGQDSASTTGGVGYIPGELRSRMLNSAAKKLKINFKKNKNQAWKLNMTITAILTKKEMKQLKHSVNTVDMGKARKAG